LITHFLDWARRTTSGLPRVFWYLWLGTLINRVGIFVVPFLALFLKNQQGLKAEEATFIVSLYGLGSFIAQFTGGYLSDLWGRRPTMLVSCFITPVTLMLLGSVTNFWFIALLTLLTGLFTDLYRPAASALIADIVPAQDLVRAFSLRYWAINLGAAIGLSLGGWLATQNYKLLFIGDALTTLAFGIVTLLLIPETRLARSSSSTEAAPAPPRFNFISQLKSSFAGERALLRFTLLFTFLLLVSASVYAQNSVTMPLVMEDAGFSEAAYGNVVALNGIIIVVFSLRVNQALAHYPYLLVMAFSAALIGVGYGIYGFASSIGIYAVGVVLWTVGELVGSPVAPAVIAELSPPYRKGFYQGLLGSAYGLSYFTGPAIGGLIYSYTSAEILWALCLAISLVVALGYAVFMRPFYLQLKAATPQASTVITEEPGSLSV
jgi:MFS family permease